LPRDLLHREIEVGRSRHSELRGMPGRAGHGRAGRER
jgi:hypothetical protein